MTEGMKLYIKGGGSARNITSHLRWYGVRTKKPQDAGNDMWEVEIIEIMQKECLLEDGFCYPLESDYEKRTYFSPIKAADNPQLLLKCIEYGSAEPWPRVHNRKNWYAKDYYFAPKYIAVVERRRSVVSESHTGEQDVAITEKQDGGV